MVDRAIFGIITIDPLVTLKVCSSDPYRVTVYVVYPIHLQMATDHADVPLGHINIFKTGPCNINTFFLSPQPPTLSSFPIAHLPLLMT